MNQVRVVIFDFGGVVVYGCIPEMEQFISKTLCLPLETVQKTFFLEGNDLIEGKITEMGFWKNYATKMKRDLPSFFERLWTLFLLEHTVFNQEVLNVVKDLKSKNFIVSLLSNISFFQAKLFQERGFFDDFDPVISSCEVGFSKPHPYIYRFLLRKIQLQPESCVFIDNDERNVRAANDLGMTALHFTTTEKLKTDLLNVSFE